MENKYSYRLVPEWNTAFRILENCCYDKLVYQGEQIGLAGTFDKENQTIGMLLCMCSEHPKILNFSETEFNSLLQMVISKQESQQK